MNKQLNLYNKTEILKGKIKYFIRLNEDKCRTAERKEDMMNYLYFSGYIHALKLVLGDLEQQ